MLLSCVTKQPVSRFSFSCSPLQSLESLQLLPLEVTRICMETLAAKPSWVLEHLDWTHWRIQPSVLGEANLAK